MRIDGKLLENLNEEIVLKLLKMGNQTLLAQAWRLRGILKYDPDFFY